MDPISAGLAIGGSLIKGVGALQAGNQNKRVLDAQSREELVSGNAEELRIRDAARAAMGQQVAAQSSNGFFGGTGSALDALRESKINAALDGLSVRREAQSRARSLQAQGKQARTEGRFGLVEGLIGAGSAYAGYQSDWAAAKRGSTPPQGNI